MSKTVIQTQFDHFVSKQLWPLFKARGYRKTGNNFRYYDASGWGKILNIQKSQYGDRDNIRFTLNTGLYLQQAERLMNYPISGAKFLEYRCLIRQRLDALGGSQQWYDLHEDAEPALMRVHEEVVQYVLPYLDRIQNVDTLLQQLLREHEHNSPLVPSLLAIKTLFVCGYQRQAREWVEHELATTSQPEARRQMQQVLAEFETPAS